MACFQQFVGQLLSEAVRKQRPGIVDEAVFKLVICLKEMS
jgi:hypothetical protein